MLKILVSNDSAEMKWIMNLFFTYFRIVNKFQHMSVRPLIVVCLFLTVFLSDGCASSHSHKNKKLKPGKPIPCPHKDC